MTKENHKKLTQIFTAVHLTLPDYPLSEDDAADAELEFSDVTGGQWFRPGPLADVILGDPQGCFQAINSLCDLAGVDRYHIGDFDPSRWLTE